AALRLSAAQRKNRLGSIKRLNAGFLIHAKNQRVFRWIHIKSHHFKQLLFKLGIWTEVECFQTMEMEVMFFENTVHITFESFSFSARLWVLHRLIPLGGLPQTVVTIFCLVCGQ